MLTHQVDLHISCDLHRAVWKACIDDSLVTFGQMIFDFKGKFRFSFGLEMVQILTPNFHFRFKEKAKVTWKWVQNNTVTTSLPSKWTHCYGTMKWGHEVWKTWARRGQTKRCYLDALWEVEDPIFWTKSQDISAASILTDVFFLLWVP